LHLLVVVCVLCSAVHLKEMHRCTVDGCTMMFSSRRSRNRHSANPNPKLHLPQTVRRKLPDAAGALGIPDSASGEFEDDGSVGTAAGGVYPGSPMSLSSQYALQCAAAAAGSAVHRQIVLDDDDDEDDGNEDDDIASNHSTAAESVSTVPEDNFSTSAAASAAAAHHTAPLTPPSETALNLVCTSRSSSAAVSTTTGNENEGSETGAGETDHGMSGSAAAGQMSGGGTIRGTSKRKSAVPTRCSAQQLQDDELISDDNSSDVPATKRRNVEPTNAADAAGPSATAETTESRPDKPVEPNNNKVHGRGSATEGPETGESDEEVDRGIGSGTGDAAENPPVPRTSTPTAAGDEQTPDQGPGSPNACSEMSDDFSSIASDDERKSEKTANEDKDGAKATENHDNPGAEHDDVNDSGVVVDRAGRRDDEVSGGKTVPDSAAENGPSATGKDDAGQGSAQCGFVCLVEGCNATFPSKRSRDRHSANLNLHRKLLSTSGTPSGKSMAAVFTEHPFPPPVAAVHSSAAGATDEAGCLVLNLSRTAAEIPAAPSTTGPDTRATTAASAAAAAEAAETTVQAADTDGEASRSSSVGPEDEPAAAAAVSGGGDSTAVTCHVCPPLSATFRDKLALKEHLETVHPRETHRCTVAGCDKLFSTRKSRNRHSQNDNLHRHLVVAAPR